MNITLISVGGLKEDYLDQGKTGINAGEGFYSYQ